MGHRSKVLRLYSRTPTDGSRSLRSVLMAIWAMFQTSPNNGWSEWADLSQGLSGVGPAITGPPVVFQNADGRLEIFAAGPDGTLGHMYQTWVPWWSNWYDLGPPIVGQPAVFQNADGRLEIFAAGPDGNLGHMFQTAPNNGWSVWADLGPAITGPPVVFQNADGRLEVFAVGPDGSLGHMFQTAPSIAPNDDNWSRWWADLGPDITGPPVVFQNADGRLEIFAVGPDGDLGHMFQTAPNNGWSVWADLGPAITGPPVVFQNADGRLEVFAVGPDGSLGHMFQTAPSIAPNDDNWSRWWADLGPAITGPLAIFQNAPVPVTAPKTIRGASMLGSNVNYLLYSNCNLLTATSVTIQITQDLIPSNGFGFQLNCYAQSANSNAAMYQQFMIREAPGNHELACFVDCFIASGSEMINDEVPLAALSSTTLPAGFILTITLTSDPATGNITAATYLVVDNTGATKSQTISLLGQNNEITNKPVTSANLAPLVAFQLNLVGHSANDATGGNTEFSSGAGVIEMFSGGNPMTVLTYPLPGLPAPCIPSWNDNGLLPLTAETSNSLYSTLPLGPGQAFAQLWSTTSLVSPPI